MKKLVVVTGASSGIGRETAKRFSEEGHPLLLLARRRELMEELHLPHCLCRSVDMTQPEAVKKAVEEAEALYGKTDLLINAAGLMLLGHPETQPFEEWDRMIDVNIKGVLSGMRAVLDDMVARREGTVINISSIAGRKTFDNHAVYCGTKYAVHAITEAVRRELSGSNVRLIVLAPGVVDTPLLSHTSDEQIKADYNVWKKSIHGGLDAGTIAECALFAYRMPQSVCLREMVIAATLQAD